MDETVGKLTSDSAILVLRTVAQRRRTGILELRGDTRTERLYFVGGELYLAPDHPLALGLGADESAEDSGSRIASGVTPGELWCEQAVDRLQAWTEGEYRFIEDPTAISTDLIGPLPSFSIVMAGSVRGLDEFSLLRLLGGDEARLAVAPAGVAPPPDSVELDPHEAFFLSRMERAVSVKDLLRQSDLPRSHALQRLCRLFSAGLICNAEDLPRSRPGSLLDTTLLEKFSSRIAESLERRPVGLDIDEHRKRIASLLGRLGGMTYYELLGIGTGASSEEIHDAYSDLARVVHPCQAEGLGLGGKEGGMMLLLEKATEAYLTLNDRDRSRRYLKEIGFPGDIHGGQQTADIRREEVQEMAEENYRRAQAMVAREDFHFAVELLQQAVRVDPQAKYYVLLARCQARNPQWISKAIASYGRALQLAEQDLQIRYELAQVLEAAGDRARAKREYETILQRQPSHSEATLALQRLGQKPKPSRSEPGWLEKLRSRLRTGRK